MLTAFGRPDPAEDALRQLVAIRGVLDSLEAQLVATLRSRGFTWVDVAKILAVTPQGAGRRHRTAGRRVVRRSDRGDPFIPVRR